MMLLPAVVRSGETIALVHGAWHGGWAWDRLAVELERRGHRVVAPDLPCEDVDAGAADYARCVIEALNGAEATIVVGHSLGGTTVPLVPAQMHVYLCAYVPQPGRALVDREPKAFGPGFGASLLRDELGRSWWPDVVAAARDLQYPAADAALAQRLRRQARKPSVEACQLDSLPDTPRAYVVCDDDYVIPPAWQRKVARSELSVEPIELSSGHSPMLGCAGELAEILDRLASTTEPPP
jgi:pimeloyl-ACP methyl ester carboxylesterase